MYETGASVVKFCPVFCGDEYANSSRWLHDRVTEAVLVITADTKGILKVLKQGPARHVVLLHS